MEGTKAPKQQQRQKDHAKPKQEQQLKTLKASKKEFNPPEKEYLHTPIVYQVPFVSDSERIYALNELLGLWKWCGGLSNKSNTKRKTERYGENSIEKFLKEEVGITSKDVVRKRVVLGVDRCLDVLEKGQLVAVFVCVDPNPAHLTEHLVVAAHRNKILTMPFCLADYTQCSNFKIGNILAIGIKHSHISEVSHHLITEAGRRFSRVLNIMESIIKGNGIPKEEKKGEKKVGKKVEKEEVKEEVKGEVREEEHIDIDIEGQEESKEEHTDIKQKEEEEEEEEGKKEESNEHKEESTEDNSEKEKNKGKGRKDDNLATPSEQSDTHNKPQFFKPVIRKEGKKRLTPTTGPNNKHHNKNHNRKNKNGYNNRNNTNKKPKTS